MKIFSCGRVRTDDTTSRDFCQGEKRSKILDSVKKKKKKKKDLPFNYTPVLRENQVENFENLTQNFS